MAVAPCNGGGFFAKWRSSEPLSPQMETAWFSACAETTSMAYLHLSVGDSCK
jgi:hypothetical protein